MRSGGYHAPTMYSIESIDVPGYGSRPVPNTLFRQSVETAHLAVVLPGLSYTCRSPALYYPTLLLVDGFGADVLWVEYDYFWRPGFADLPEPEQDRRLFADAEAALRAALSRGPYERLTLVGKSLGTLAVAHLLSTDAPLEKTQALWLTPLLSECGVRERVREGEERSLAIVGTADPEYAPEALAGVEHITIEGADHALEVRGDAWASLRALEKALGAIEAFVEAGG